MSKKSGLGKGLGALLSDDNNFLDNDRKPTEEENILAIEDLYPRKDQPRKYFDKDALNDLADSIKIHGIIQPLLVRKRDHGYEIVAGERRYRAAKLAKIKEVPVVIRDLDDKEVKEISIIENIQRKDLNPIEEAMAYRSLIDDFGITQEEVASHLGKSRSYIANIIRLLNLDKETQDHIIEGRLTSSQGRTLLSISNIKDRQKALKAFLDKETTIRDVEKKVKVRPRDRDIFVLDIENRLTEALEAKVSLKASKKGGKILINYYDNDDLERLINLFEEKD